MKKIIEKSYTAMILMIISVGASYAGTNATDPLSKFLKTAQDWMTGVGVAMVTVSFIVGCIVVAMIDEKTPWLKKLVWILAAGAMMVGASQFLDLFSISGAVF